MLHFHLDFTKRCGGLTHAKPWHSVALSLFYFILTAPPRVHFPYSNRMKGSKATSDYITHLLFSEGPRRRLCIDICLTSSHHLKRNRRSSSLGRILVLGKPLLRWKQNFHSITRNHGNFPECSSASVMGHFSQTTNQSYITLR